MNGEHSESIKNTAKYCFFKHLARLTVFSLLIFMWGCSHPRTDRGMWRPPEGRRVMPQYTAEEIIAAMQERLDLTDEQEKRVYPIMETYCKKQHDIMEKYKEENRRGESCCMRCELQRLGESTEKQLAEFLTEKQMREYQKLQEELQPKPPTNAPPAMGRGRPGGMGGGGWGGMPPGM